MDIGLLLQILLPEVKPRQLVFSDVHAEGPDPVCCDQAVELGEAGGKKKESYDSSWELSPRRPHPSPLK